MAAGNWIAYDSFKEFIGDGTIDLDGHTFKCLLTTDAYTPDLTHDFIDDITDELAGGDYAQQTLGSVTWTRSGSTVTLDCADISFGSNVTLTAKYAVIYDDTVTSPAADALCFYVDLSSGGGSVSSTGSTFQITINASGIMTLTGATS